MKKKIKTTIDNDWYNYDENCEVIAKELGLVVVYPEENQLQIDLDSDEAYDEFQENYDAFLSVETVLKEIHPSRSGLPNRHITLTFPKRIFTEAERIALQFALGSDPVRERLNMMRLFNGCLKPSRLFEKP